MAPKGPWGELLGDANDADRTGGMRAIVMERNIGSDGRPGYIRVTVEAISSPHHDTKILVNDHYDLAVDENQTSAKDAVNILDELWDESMQRAEKICDLSTAVGFQANAAE